MLPIHLIAIVWILGLRELLDVLDQSAVLLLTYALRVLADSSAMLSTSSSIGMLCYACECLVYP